MKRTLSYLLWSFLTPVMLFILLPILGDFMRLPLDFPAALEQLDLRTLDWRFKLRGPIQPKEKIVIVAIDQKSVAVLGEPPWSRKEHARLVRKMKEAGARLTVFDILFATPAASDPEGDAELAAAVKEAGNVIVSLQTTQSEMVQQPGPELLQRFYLTGIVPSGSLPVASRVEAPLPALLRNSLGLGFMNVRQDVDGGFRRGFGILDYRPADGGQKVGGYLPSLCLATATAFKGVPPTDVRFEQGRGILLGEELLPTGWATDFVVNFLGPSHTFPTYSFSDVVEGKVPPEDFRGGVVLVGVTLFGAADWRPNPFDPTAFGVEFQASALHTMLAHSWIRRPPTVAFYLLVLFFSLVTGLAMPRIRLWQGLAVVITLALAYLAVAEKAFLTNRMSLEIVPPLVWLLTGYVGVAFQMLRVERRTREIVRRSFERYVAPTVVEEIVRKKEPSLPMGQRRDITVLFADIRNFTATAERLDPWQVTYLLNLFFDRTSAIIFHYGGIVDKYIGDCVMALFGLLEGQADHARRAVVTALEIQKEAAIMAEEWVFGGALEPLQVAIGINTGVAIVGEVGSHRHTQYTAIGDTVNLAWRLQELCPTHSATVLISRYTHDEVSRLIESEPVGEVVVPGRGEKVELFRLLGPRRLGRVASPQRDGLADGAEKAEETGNPDRDAHG